MRGVRGAIDAAIVALLLKPMARWMMRRTRRRTRDYVRVRLVRPAQALFAGARPSRRLAVVEIAALASPVAAAQDARARRDLIRLALALGAAAVAAGVVSTAVTMIVRRRRRARAAQDAATPAARAAVPVSVERDELRAIKGIGPVSAERLRALGVTTTEQIAAWSPNDVRRIAEQLELTAARIENEDWIGQAQALGAKAGVA